MPNAGYTDQCNTLMAPLRGAIVADKERYPEEALLILQRNAINRIKQTP